MGGKFALLAQSFVFKLRLEESLGQVLLGELLKLRLEGLRILLKLQVCLLHCGHVGVGRSKLLFARSGGRRAFLKQIC